MRRSFCTVIVAILVTACGGGETGPAQPPATKPVASVSIQGLPADVVTGASAQLAAVVRDASGASLPGRSVTWTSNNIGVATVSASGLLAGVTPGSAVITATSEGQVGTATVTVRPAPVASVALVNPPSAVVLGDTVRLRAATRDAAGTLLENRPVVWSATGTALAVDSMGLVTTLDLGQGTVTATSEGRTTSVSLTVTGPRPAVRTFQRGTTLYLERAAGGDVARVGVGLRWGGTITEASLNGENFVNAFDAGREVQIAFYDGKDAETYRLNPDGSWSTTWGWNPVQGGDWHIHGSPVTAATTSDATLYVRTVPNHWYPENKGGGPARAVPSDVVFEQWVTPLAETIRGFRVRYRVTHTGSDDHTLGSQELPAVYTNQEYGRFVTYGGDAPFTNGPVSIRGLPAIDPTNPSVGLGRTPATERWGALVNAAGSGLTVYVPSAYPWTAAGFNVTGPGGPSGSGTNYFALLTPWDLPASAIREAEYYVFVGDYTQARTEIYRVRSRGVTDALPPYGVLDVPARDAEIRGVVDVAGWVIDNDAVARVDVLVDGRVVGTATYGAARPDVQTAWPGAPLNTGYVYRLDTGALAVGRHVISVRPVDRTGNATVLGPTAVTVVR